MSFIITVHVGEGIVMASDSRTTYTKTDIVDGAILQKFGVHNTNSTNKTFICPNNCGISTCGDASIRAMPITGYIQSFIRESVLSTTDINLVPQILLDYFRNLEPIPNVDFIVAGYQKIESQIYQKIYKERLNSNQIEEIDTHFQGATWDGETETLIKLIKSVSLKNEDGTYLDLCTNEILWNYFTLQDAIDFAQYAVETTINTLHFQNVIETVGGPIDILIIEPEKTFWLKKKDLKSI